MNLPSPGVDGDQGAARFQGLAKILLEDFFPVAILGRVLLPNQRIASHRVEFLKILQPNRPEFKQVAFQNRLEIERHLARGERVAVRNLARLQPALEPLRALRRGSVGESFRTDPPARHLLQTIVANRSSRMKRLRNVILIHDIALFG
jgi:hypothetical protein